MTKVLLLYFSICKLTLGTPIYHRTHAHENEVLEGLILSMIHDRKPSREVKPIPASRINFEKLILGHIFVVRTAMKHPLSSSKVTSILSPPSFQNEASLRAIRREKRAVEVLKLPTANQPSLKQLTETVQDKEKKPSKSGKVSILTFVSATYTRLCRH